MPLSPSQHKAVTETGVQLILAGPGSGKTRVITEKILHHEGRPITLQHADSLTWKAVDAVMENLVRLVESWGQSIGSRTSDEKRMKCHYKKIIRYF